MSERLTWTQWAEIWSIVLGVKASYEQADVNDWFEGSGAPEAFVDEFKEAYAYIAEFGYDGGDPDCLKIDQVSSDAITCYEVDLTAIAAISGPYDLCRRVYQERRLDVCAVTQRDVSS